MGTRGWPTRQPPWLVDSLSGNLALRSWWSLGLGQTNQWPKKRDHLHGQWPYAICQPEANLQPLKAILQPSLSHHSSIPSRSQNSLAHSRPLQWLVKPLTNGIQNAPNSASVPILKRSYTPNSQHFHRETDDLLSKKWGLRVACQTKAPLDGAPSRCLSGLVVPDLAAPDGVFKFHSGGHSKAPQRRCKMPIPPGIWWTSWENIQDGLWSIMPSKHIGNLRKKMIATCEKPFQLRQRCCDQHICSLRTWGGLECQLYKLHLSFRLLADPKSMFQISWLWPKIWSQMHRQHFSRPRALAFPDALHDFELWAVDWKESADRFGSVLK